MDSQALSRALGVPVVETVGNKNKGVKELKSIISSLKGDDVEPDFRVDYGKLESSIEELSKELESLDGFSLPPRWSAIKLLENDQSVMEKLKFLGRDGIAVVQRAAVLSQDFASSHEEEPRAHIGLCRHLKAEEIESLCVQDSSGGRFHGPTK